MESKNYIYEKFDAEEVSPGYEEAKLASVKFEKGVVKEEVVDDPKKSRKNKGVN